METISAPVHTPKALPWGGAALLAGEALLLLSLAGQGALMGPWLAQRPILWLGFLVLWIPLGALCTGTFTNVPFLSPAAVGKAALLAVVALAAGTTAAELLLLAGALPDESPDYARGLCRGLMHAGWLAVPPLLYVRRGLRPDATP